jgi:hypothetical protein
MRESDDGLRSLITRYLPHPHHIQAIELSLRQRGVPDMNICIDSIETWLELKATAGWAVMLRPGQIGWAVTRIRHGGRVTIAVRRRTLGGKRVKPADELWLLDGKFARELKADGLRWALSHPPALLGRWTGSPKAWQWDEVRATLIRT